MDRITAKIERVRYRSPESRWTIAKTDKGIIKGVIPWDPETGQIVDLEGTWKLSKFNGDQEFDFKGCMLSIPEDPRALLDYAVEITKGLGDAAKEKIWAKYGENWESQDVLDIPGISRTTQQAWFDTLSRIREKSAMTQAISFLLSHKATMKMSMSAWEAWGTATVGKVTQNPYIMADLPHYSFADAEPIAESFGIEKSDPRRVESAIKYVINTVANDVGTLVPHAALTREIAKYGITEIPNDVSGVIVIDDGLSEADYADEIDYKNELEIYERMA